MREENTRLLKACFRFVCYGGAFAGVFLSAPMTRDAPFSLVSGAAYAAETVSRAETIVIGRVTGRVRRVMPRLEAAVNWLVPHLGDQGIRKGAVIVARDAKHMESMLRSGRVDIITESVFTGLRFEARTKAKILLHEWRGGQAGYRSVFIVPKNSAVTSLAGLKGMKIVFEDPGSTSSFILPMAMLRAAGLKPVALPDVGAKVPGGQIGYVFAGDEINIAAWVAWGRVDAGAFSDRDWARKEKVPERFKKRLRIMTSSQSMIRSLLIVRPGLPDNLVTAIEKAYLNFADDPNAAALRHKYYKVSRYTRFTGASGKALSDARRLYRGVQDLLK